MLRTDLRFALSTAGSIVALLACEGSDSQPPTSGSSNSGGSGPSVTAATQSGGSNVGGSNLGGSNLGGSNLGASGASATSTPAGGNLSTSGGATSAMSGGTSNVGMGGSLAAGGFVGTGGKSAGATGAGGTSAATTGPASGGTSSAGGSTATSGTTVAMHWVSTWTASPYVDTNASNAPPIALAGSVLRQVTHVSLGGSKLRVQFSNLYGKGPLTIAAAHLALCKATPAVNSTIDVTTDKGLTFGGSASVTLAAGQETWSDAIDFVVPNHGNISITTALTAVPSTLTQHSGSRTTSYFQASSTTVNAASMATATTKDLWFFISGIDVMAGDAAKSVVAIGDSITDGRGTDTNYNNRWTDILATRLLANAATAQIAITNQGIGGTALVGASGTAAQARFKRDVLGQSGVKYVIVFDGVNDIGGNVTYASMKVAYDDLISRAHGQGLKIFGATILPFGGNSYYSETHEAVRQQVNAYVKSGAFDGYIDFDAAVTDGGSPPKLQTAYATWAQTDYLHPSPAGYKKMGDSVNLTLFAP